MPSTEQSVKMRFATLVPLSVSIIALILAGWALLRPTLASDDSYTDAEVADATARVCTAYDLAFRGVALQTNLTSAPDPSEALAAAANARLALVVASEDLVAAVDGAPQAPTALRDAVRQLAAEYRTVAANYLAGIENDQPPIAEALQRAETAATTINPICRK